MVETKEIPYARFGFDLDDGIPSRTAIGLIVLATDHTIEYEWRTVMSLPGVGLYENRILNSPDIRPETLRQMDELIAPGVALIRPGERIDVVAFGCTSASMVLGEEQVFNRIKAVRPEAVCTTPITAARVGLEAMNTKRIALLTPYVQEINEAMASYLEKRGISVVRIGSFEHPDDNEVARIDADSLRHAILELGQHDDVDAVFVSCTSLRLVDHVASIEQELGKPVTSSNHAMAWHALRLGNIHDKLPQFGRLFTV
ncbi:maleate cis-trans isomerase family protein [Paraburkholderia caribensis]|uniref:maleate cis-trans isomerase family protein n=1 Tax=Paraburkholderia caribensis TaxID=75105 RepID=UPI001CACF1D7|nr:Asp/Glu racemase [Paraburkholderia caribensis]CAG9242143.1 Maleate cis-trans isomerase [Paraburkholderia caribensis]